MIWFLKPPLNRRFALILAVGAMWLLGGLGIGVLHRRRPLVLCRPRWLIMLFALATAFVAILFFFTSRAHEPGYQGRRLSVWLESYLDRDGGETTTEQARAADRAVQHIGTNALPFLIEMIRVKDPWLKTKLIDLIEKECWIKIHILPARVVRERGWKAFQALGGIAKPA